MEEAPIAKEVKQFLASFAEKEASLLSLRVDRDLRGFRGLFSGFSGLYRLHQLHLKTTARDFDLFEILRIRHLEEKMHTPVLRNLLSPNGSHAQGDLFYRSFVRTVLPPEDHDLFSQTQFLQVEAEKHTGSLGRIDILVTNPDSANRFAVVIENKIYAADQPEQLERYYRYAKDFLGLPPDRIRLLYLTLWGTQPAEFSLRPTLKMDLEREGVFHCISYHQHIVNWLEGLLDLVEAPVVRETIVQYLKTIKTL